MAYYNVEDIDGLVMMAEIGYWGDWDEPVFDKDGLWKQSYFVSTNVEEADFERKLLTRKDIREAIAKIQSGDVPLKQEIIDWTREGIDAMDADSADCVLQVAMFGEVPYG